MFASNKGKIFSSVQSVVSLGSTAVLHTSTILVYVKRLIGIGIRHAKFGKQLLESIYSMGQDPGHEAG